jgi:hypothetical protein
LSLSTVENEPTINGDDEGGIYRLRINTTDNRTFYDIKNDGTLIKIEIEKTLIRERNVYPDDLQPPLLPNTLHQEGLNTLTSTWDESGSFQTVIKVDDVYLFQSEVHEYSETYERVKTFTIPDRGDVLYSDPIDMPYYAVLTQLRSYEHNVVEISDFDARNGIIALTEFVENETADVYISDSAIGAYGWSIPTVGFITEFWGEAIIDGGTFMMTWNVDGTVDIPRQYIYTTEYKGDPYDYEIKGSGTWDNCGSAPKLLINYDI